MKTTYRQRTLQALLVVGVIGSYSGNAWATLVITPNSAPSVNGFDSDVKNDDLIEDSSSALSGTTHTGWNFGSDANLNDGSSSFNFVGTPGTGYGSFSNSPVAIFTLDQGYDLGKINAIFATDSNYSTNYANQYYDIHYETASNPGTWVLLTNVDYRPFGSSAGNASTFVSITDSSGTVASDVKKLRFTILNNSGGGSDGVLIKELDVFEAVPVPEPGSFAMLLFGGVMFWVVGRKGSRRR